MSIYIVEEKVLYRVMADSEENAIAQIEDNAERDKLCIGVDERIAYLDDDWLAAAADEWRTRANG